ncbi:hypothetical protein AVEN_184405-1 [Araneus ventricosus]|uniref:Uncharacterized protein n=1 Tax=Araneus ventricosus TaxID=182803 RepID=A0A4Y2BHZ5_ARAVE|nr:hypothetical protein AVEN_184405-1 [Araneus ventricosus]
MKRQNSFDVSNSAGSLRIDGNPAGSDRIEIGAGLQSLIGRAKNPEFDTNRQSLLKLHSGNSVFQVYKNSVKTLQLHILLIYIWTTTKTTILTIYLTTTKKTT